MHGQYSVKSDVFSFGVLLLEIISGKKNSAFYQSDGGEDLLSYVSLPFTFLSVRDQHFISYTPPS